MTFFERAGVGNEGVSHDALGRQLLKSKRARELKSKRARELKSKRARELKSKRARKEPHHVKPKRLEV
eukprot:scaffold7450_cov267-Pinguiococcus_pyrenoidosus.AAC.5